MAVVQYTGVVNQLRGKLNGSVFNKGKTSFTLQKKQQPPIGARGNQLQRRAAYSFVQRSWRDLTDAQRTAWQTCAQSNPATNRFGDQVILSGYNQFLRCNLLFYQMSNFVLKSPQTTPAPALSIASLAISGVAANANEFGELIMSGNSTGAYNTGATNTNYIIDVSLPQSTGVTVYHRGWRFLGFQATTAAINLDWSANLGNRYPSLSPGVQLFFRSRLFDRPTGAIQFTRIDRFIVPAAPVISSWSAVPNGAFTNVTFAISYVGGATGVPLFYQVRVYTSTSFIGPPSPGDANQFLPIVSAALETANSVTVAATIPVGVYVGYRVDIVFSPTGAVVATDFVVVHRS